MMQAENSEVNSSVNSGVQVTKNMLDAASAEGVFSKEIRSGDTLVITASEIVAAMGAGGSNMGGGGGGGGGGTAVGRPVAVISVDSAGEVTVTPIVDPTKIALAFITVLGSFLVMLGRIRKVSAELASDIEQ